MRFARPTRHAPPRHIGQLLRQFRISLNWSTEDMDKAVFNWGTLGLEQLELGDPVWLDKFSLKELKAFKKEFDLDLYAWYWSLSETSGVRTAQSAIDLSKASQLLVATHGKGERTYTSQEVKQSGNVINWLKHNRGEDTDVRQVTVCYHNERGPYKVKRMAVFEEGVPAELCEMCCGGKVNTEPVAGRVVEWIDEEGKERRNG